MAGIDDDLKSELYSVTTDDSENEVKNISKNDNSASDREVLNNEQPKPNVSVKVIEQKEKSWMNIFWSVVCYCVDASFIVLSFIMINDFYGSYPLVFSVALIIWLAFRILSFKRNSTIDFVMGLVLLLMAIVLYYFVLKNPKVYIPYLPLNQGRWRYEIVGRIIIPTIYLGFFCAWDIIRRKKQEENHEK